MRPSLSDRNLGQCELCQSAPSSIEFVVSPKSDDLIENMVALCQTCVDNMNNPDASNHWRCLEGSIWSAEPAVQALSYRILKEFDIHEWASNILSSVDLDEPIIQWALHTQEVADVHKDAFGNVLENGDNVVITQALQVKGTNFTASKGTVVKKIKLVADNPEHIEGKVNEQTIVILTKFVKKN